VRSIDCAAKHPSLGQSRYAGPGIDEGHRRHRDADAQTLVFKLKKPFPLLPSALGKVASSMACIMPERLAKIDSHTQITEAIGSGPYKFAKDKWCRDRPLSSSASMAINRVRAPAVLRRRQSGAAKPGDLEDDSRRRHVHRGVAGG